MSRVIVFADDQHPFVHRDYLDFARAVRNKYHTDTAIHIGDEADHHALSDWEHDPDGFSAGHELQAAKESLKPLFKAFPKMKVCKSNHTDRIYRLAKKAGIPRAYLKDYREFLEAPKGWEWADEWEIDGVLYKHGVEYTGIQGALNAAKDAMQSCVIGHLHAEAGILHWSNGKRPIFGMCVGSGINVKAYAFEYGLKCRKKPILSCAAVIDGRPYLETMNLDKHGRWDWSL